jgi:hypothetical protein
MVRISLPPTESWAAYDVPSIGSELLCWVLFGTSGALWFAGLVHIISAMEACDTYKPWHDKHTHRTFFRPDTSKCPARWSGASSHETRRWSDSGRVMGDSGIVKRFFALELARKLYFFPLGAGWAFRL